MRDSGSAAVDGRIVIVALHQIAIVDVSVCSTLTSRFESAGVVDIEDPTNHQPPHPKPPSVNDLTNYYAAGRSNDFAVKYEAAFREGALSLGIDVITPDLCRTTADGVRPFGIAVGNHGGSGA